jgi:hypothetical protein
MASPAKVIDKASKDMVAGLASEWPWGTHATVDRDVFNGTVVGWYRTREGHPGLVLQQNDSRIVHVYRESGVWRAA